MLQSREQSLKLVTEVLSQPASWQISSPSYFVFDILRVADRG